MLLINEGFVYAYEGSEGSEDSDGEDSVANGVLGRINGTFNGANQTVVAAPGAGKKIVVRSLVISVEDSPTDVQFNSRTGTTNTSVGPTWDIAANATAVLPVDEEGWFEALTNQALVVTSNGPVDIIGTYRTVTL